jgi:hypothetical protein
LKLLQAIQPSACWNSFNIGRASATASAVQHAHPADGVRDPLEQPSEIHQTLSLGKAGAGKDECDREGETGDRRVDRPSALAPSSEAPREHKAGYGQSHEGRNREQVVEGGMHTTVFEELVRGSGRVAAHRIGDEDPRTNLGHNYRLERFLSFHRDQGVIGLFKPETVGHQLLDRQLAHQIQPT